MAASNNRIKEYETVHHVLNRIAHKVYFLGDDERNDLVEIMRRAAEYCGIRLLAWCVMTNHFHLMLYLPSSIEIDEREVLRRYGVLKGEAASGRMEQQISDWRRREGEEGEGRVGKWLESQRRRMYDVGEYMKIVKQWFTEEYNRRNSHVGTLWESEYQDRPVEMTVKEMSKRMGYIHLNPIRAAAASTYDGYVWSSFSAFVRGDDLAIGGMRFVYDADDLSLDVLREQHIALLDSLLEYEKRRRAEEIARKRAAGYEMPVDHLTNEAMIAQAELQFEKMRRVSEELRAGAGRALVGLRERRKLDEERVIELLKLHPDFSVGAIARALGMAEPTVYKHLRELKDRGRIGRAGRGAPWEVYTI